MELAVFVVVFVMKAMVIVVAVEMEMAVGDDANNSDSGKRSDGSVLGESSGDGGVCSTGTSCLKGG